MDRLRLLEHEVNEMMRPFRIGPVQAGQPGSAGGMQSAGADEGEQTSRLFMPEVSNQ